MPPGARRASPLRLRATSARMLAVIALAALVAPRARGDVSTDRVRRCIGLAEEGQRYRDDGRYVSARDVFARCGRETCPAAISRDCMQWLAEVEPLVPSVVIALRDADRRDVTEARVVVDGIVVAKEIDGRPIALDPGAHTIVLEAASGARAVRKVVLHAGEKGRVVDVQLEEAASSGAPVTAPAPKTAPELPRPTPPETSRLAWVLAGVGVVAIGSFAGFGLSGSSDLSDLESSPCARTRTCAASDVDAVRTRFLVADVSLGVGVVAIAAAAWLFFSSPRKSAAVDHAGEGPAPGSLTGRGARSPAPR